MKFTYDDKQEDRECVAIISSQGTLMFPPVDGNSVTICPDGLVHALGLWNPDKATRKFYPGDSVTITF